MIELKSTHFPLKISTYKADFSSPNILTAKLIENSIRSLLLITHCMSPRFHHL